MLRFVLLLTICFLAVVATATDGTGPVDEPSELTSAVQNRNVSVINSLYSLPNNIKLFVGQNKALRTGLSGAAAGSVQVATLMWLRTITSYQSSYDVSFFEAVETLYAEGGLERFYRGISFALVQGPLSRFGSIAANSLAESALMTNNSDAYLIWLNATLRKGLPADSIGDSGTFSNDYGANLGLLPASVSASISKALTATTDQYRSVYLAAVEQCVRLNAGLLRQLSPAAVGSVLSGMWRVLLMPLDTLKVCMVYRLSEHYLCDSMTNSIFKYYNALHIIWCVLLILFMICCCRPFSRWKEQAVISDCSSS